LPALADLVSVVVPLYTNPDLCPWIEEQDMNTVEKVAYHCYNGGRPTTPFKPVPSEEVARANICGAFCSQVVDFDETTTPGLGTDRLRYARIAGCPVAVIRFSSE
jgi:hypothetical protein